MQKVYYDSVNNKEVVDVTGLKAEADVKTEFGLDATTQILVIDHSANERSEVVNGTLQKFNVITRSENAATARESNRQGKETSVKAKNGWSDQDFADLKTALG